MDVERVRRLLSNQKCLRGELEGLLKEAIAANERELAYEIRDVIEERFPPLARRGGPAETVGRYKGMERHFGTAIEAYIWLVERFIEVRPEVFTDIKWETTGYVAVGQRRSEGHAIRNYFAKSPTKLFRESPHLADNPNNYCRLANAWYANKNLSNAQKFDILCRFGWVVGLTWRTDWDLEVLDPSEQLANLKVRTKVAERALDELDALLLKS